MTDYEVQLWNRIKTFEFDQPTTTFTFAKRLAKENGFTRHFAASIIEEYRKFIFLCCVSNGEIAPSHLVDLAWHLHLTYTRSYWTDLCENTIDRPLHHNPTQGGQAEDRKFKGLYKDTLGLYKQYFLSDPPVEIWPKENVPPPSALIEIDPGRHWVLPKPSLNFRPSWTVLALMAVILSTLLLSGCTSYVGGIPIIFGIILIGIFWFFRKNNRHRSGSDSSGCGSILGSSGCSSDSSDSDNCDTSDSSDCSDSGGGDSCCSSGCGGGGD